MLNMSEGGGGGGLCGPKIQYDILVYTRLYYKSYTMISYTILYDTNTIL